MRTDAAELTARLIRCPSVTPEEGGALVLLEGLLKDAGFETRRVDRNGTPNLFARWGDRGAARSFGFADATQRIIVMAGVPFNTAGSTNILRVASCDELLISRTDPD